MPDNFKSVDKFDDIDIRMHLGRYILNVVYLRRISNKYAKPIPRHSHCNFELHLQSKGVGHIVTDFGQYDIAAGSVYITGPDVFHAQYFDPDHIMEEFAIGFEFIRNKEEPHSTLHSDDANHLADAILEHPFLLGSDTGLLSDYFVNLFRELKSPRLGSYEAIRSLIILILAAFLRCTSSDDSAITLPEKTLDEKRKFIIETYFLAIKPDMSPEDLAGRLCISVRQLNRIIQQYYNKSFKDKLFESKFESSLTYLSNESYKISQISEIMCFSSEFQFSSQFKKHFGLNPSEYRRRKMSAPPQ
jgi:AraC-like DNA-binding protein